MQPFEWIGPLKEAVLLAYFVVFSGIVVWAWQLRNVDALANIPFGEDGR